MEIMWMRHGHRWRIWSFGGGIMPQECSKTDESLFWPPPFSSDSRLNFPCLALNICNLLSDSSFNDCIWFAQFSSCHCFFIILLLISHKFSLILQLTSRHSRYYLSIWFNWICTIWNRLCLLPRFIDICFNFYIGCSGWIYSAWQGPFYSGHQQLLEFTGYQWQLSSLINRSFLFINSRKSLGIS